MFVVLKERVGAEGDDEEGLVYGLEKNKVV